jgi:hypothetical protein
MPRSAVKATVLLSFTLLFGIGGAIALWFGWRIPLGPAGLSLVRDMAGKSYLVLDRPHADGVMVGWEAQPPNVEIYTGSIRF